MSIYHLHAQIISRGKGRSVIAAAAYRAGQKIISDYDGKTYNFSKKSGVFHTEILLPKFAPSRYQDRAVLWNSVEAFEKRKDSQLAREINLALPHEWTVEEQIFYARQFVQEVFVDAGMCADVCWHNPKNSHNPHIHILLTLRPLNPDGTWGEKQKMKFILDSNGKKIPVIDPKTGKQKLFKDPKTGEFKLDSKRSWKRETINSTNWNTVEALESWRMEWCIFANERLPEEAWIDERSYAEQEILDIPMIHEGSISRRIKGDSRKIDVNRLIRQHNHRLHNCLDLEAEALFLREEIGEKEVKMEKKEEIESIPIPHFRISSCSAPKSKSDLIQKIEEREEVISSFLDTIQQTLKLLQRILDFYKQLEEEEEAYLKALQEQNLVTEPERDPDAELNRLYQGLKRSPKDSAKNTYNIDDILLSL